MTACRFNGLGVDLEMAVEVGDRAGLAEMLDAQGDGAVAENAAEPAQGGGMGVDGGDDAGTVGNFGEQILYMAQGLVAMQPRPLRRLPTGIEPIGRGDGEHGDIAPIATEAGRGRDGLAG